MSTQRQNEIHFSQKRIKEYEEMSEEEFNSLLDEIKNMPRIDEYVDYGYVPYFYNACYGGPGPMPDYINYIINRSGNSDAVFQAKLIFYYRKNMTFDYSRTWFIMVLIDFLEYICVKEYDGYETPYFNLERYRTRMIRQIQDKEFESVNELKEHLRYIMDEIPESVIHEF